MSVGGAIRHVLEDVAADRYVVPMSVVRGLDVALDACLAALPAVPEAAEMA